LKREDLDEFVQCYKGENLPASYLPASESPAQTSNSTQASRYQRQPTWCEEGDAALSARGASPAGRWRAYDYEEIINRDKASLDIF